MQHGRRMLQGDLWSELPNFTAVAGQLRMAETPVKLKGANWFGAEGEGRAPDGLWTHNITFYLDFLVRNGFNAVRLPFALDNVMADQGPQEHMIKAEHQLRGASYLAMMERVVDLAASRGLLILLDLHRLQAKRWADAGLWYAEGITGDTVKEAWDRIQARLCSRWNVFAADVLNEPHGAKWDDWAAAASSIGNFILSKCMRWVIFVEGVGHEGTEETAEFFWGENLVDAGRNPVMLLTKNKLVYSPHAYGPGDGSEAHHMPYFDEKDFPANMEARWRRHFGYLQRTGATIIVGEWGGFFKGKDHHWQEAFRDFLLRYELGSFYWSLNPNSQDTGGLLTSSWSTPEAAKLALLHSLPCTKVVPLLSTGRSFRCPDGPLAPTLHRCADSHANECIFKPQVCNGIYECRDRSDEHTCHGVERPCATVAGGHTGQECSFPFSYNGFLYDTCTLVDALEQWSEVGVGRCQRGYIPSLASRGTTAQQCQEACVRTPNCTYVSFAHIQGFCSGYTTACEDSQLNTGTPDYTTWRFNEHGGAWCPTTVGAHREFLGSDKAGTCGPGCASSKSVNEAARSRCEHGGAYSDGGIAHCAPSPPRPPESPPPPRPPPSPSPPRMPPLLPPPQLLIRTDVLVVAAAVGGLLCVLCLCCGVAKHALFEGPTRTRGGRRQRQIIAEEMQALASDEDCLDRVKRPPPKRDAYGRRAPRT